MGKSIGVISLKGGVGKTSVVGALGSAMAKNNKKVLLVDGNLSAPNLGVNFKVVEPEYSLHHVLSRDVHPKEAIHELEEFDLLPSSLFYTKKINPLKLKNRMTYLKRKYDYVLYDSSPSLNEETLGVMNASDELLVVTNPDYYTLSATIKAIKSARKKGVPIKGLILNKVYNKNFEISFEDIEETLGIPVMAVIPHDTKILKAVSRFKSSVNHRPNSKASEEFKKLASALMGEEYKEKGLRKFFKFNNLRKQDVNRLIMYKRVFED